MNIRPNLFRRLLAASSVAAFTFIAAGPALADRIDGKWCSPEGQRLEIDGPKITTPGGANLQGNYTRHSFSYTAPLAEPQNGSVIYMVLLNEETVEVRVGNPVGQAVVWKRCQNIS